MDRHEPDEEFVEGLEWQLRRELRRQRFDGVATTSRRWSGRRLARAAAVVVLSVLAGFATATAAQEIGERRAREYLTLRMQTELDRAELQEEFAHRRLQEVRSRVEAGDVSRAELERMRADVEGIERQRRRVQLALEEVTITGREPRTDLAAPLVRGRDFVGERLQLEMEDLETHRRAMVARRDALEAAATPRQRVQDGPRITAQVELLDEQIQALRQRQRLRQRFLAGEIDERQVIGREERLRAEAGLRASEAAERALRERVERLEALIATGDVPEAELARAEFELAMADLDLRQARLELEYAREIGQR